MWIAIVVLTAGLCLTMGFIVGRFFLIRSNLGEALVADEIGAGLKRPHTLLNNVTLQVGEKTTQIDHILVADNGIYVIETKHYGGWIFGDVQVSQWTQVIYKKKSKFLNPVHQNYGHLKAIQALFNLPNDTFVSVVVFTHDAEFKTDLGPGVVKLHDLLDYLSAERPVQLDERKMAYIVGRIEMKRLRRSIETHEYHLNCARGRVRGRRSKRNPGKKA